MISDEAIKAMSNAFRKYENHESYSDDDLRRDIDAALGHTRMVDELRNIANAKPESWDDPSDFTAWAQSRCRHILADHAGEVSP